MTWKQELGHQLKAGRIAQHLSQKALATKIGRSRQIVVRYEKGHDAPGLEVLSAIAKALSIDRLVVAGQELRFGGDTSQPRVKSQPEQMRLEFGTEYTFRRATVKIEPQSDGKILITAEIPTRTA